jgi:hypothetical protein
MDPATIAAGTVTLLVPFFKKAAEALAGEAGKSAAAFVQEKAAILWHRLRASFADDVPAIETLDRFAGDPDAHKDEVEAQVAAKLAGDNPLKDEFAAVLAEIKRTAPQIHVVQKMKEAEDAVGLKAGSTDYSWRCRGDSGDG